MLILNSTHNFTPSQETEIKGQYGDLVLSTGKHSWSLIFLTKDNIKKESIKELLLLHGPKLTGENKSL